MSYFRADWLRPILILKRKDEGMAIPPALLVLGRVPYLLTTKMAEEKSDKITTRTMVVPLNHRYFVRLNLFLIVFETAFVWPRTPKANQ